MADDAAGVVGASTGAEGDVLRLRGERVDVDNSMSVVRGSFTTLLGDFMTLMYKCICGQVCASAVAYDDHKATCLLCKVAQCAEPKPV